MPEKLTKISRPKRVQIRLSVGELMILHDKKSEFGFKEITEYMRYVSLNAKKPVVKIVEEAVK